MHLIILSGGFGNRLWPLSNSARPKQFLKLLQNDDGEPESMVQRIYRQAQALGGWDSVCIATGASQIDLLQAQLDCDVDIVVEPSRRDTFPAIALASTYLYNEKKASKNDVVAVIPIDSYVDTDFFVKLQSMEEIPDNTSFTLLGVRPTEVTSKYGYILPKTSERYSRAEEKNAVYPVKLFKEKPNLKEAAELIENGALWNCGVFVYRLGNLLDIIGEKYIAESNLSYAKLRDLYEMLPKNSFDYEIIEQAKNVTTMPFNGPWLDLGTWETIPTIFKGQAIGKVVTDGESCNNTHIINELDIPILALGIEDVIVAASSDGILLSAKSKAHRLNEMLRNVPHRPMQEVRRWGSYKVLNETENTLTKILTISPGQSISYQYHNDRKEIWTIVSGKGLLYLEGEKRKVETGNVIEIDEGIRHGIRAITELNIIEVQVGKRLSEDDIIRLELDWE